MRQLEIVTARRKTGGGLIREDSAATYKLVTGYDGNEKVAVTFSHYHLFGREKEKNSLQQLRETRNALEDDARTPRRA